MTRYDHFKIQTCFTSTGSPRGRLDRYAISLVFISATIRLNPLYLSARAATSSRYAVGDFELFKNRVGSSPLLTAPGVSLPGSRKLVTNARRPDSEIANHVPPASPSRPPIICGCNRIQNKNCRLSTDIFPRQSKAKRIAPSTKERNEKKSQNTTKMVSSLVTLTTQYKVE